VAFLAACVSSSTRRLPSRARPSPCCSRSSVQQEQRPHAPGAEDGKNILVGLVQSRHRATGPPRRRRSPGDDVAPPLAIPTGVWPHLRRDRRSRGDRQRWRERRHGRISRHSAVGSITGARDDRWHGERPCAPPTGPIQLPAPALPPRTAAHRSRSDEPPADRRWHAIANHRGAARPAGRLLISSLPSDGKRWHVAIWMYIDIRSPAPPTPMKDFANEDHISLFGWLVADG
jgi:hypothetical protein